MFLWDYDKIENELVVRRIELGNTYSVTVENIVTASQLAFWLKHYERLDEKSFKMVANIVSDDIDFTETN